MDKFWNIIILLLTCFAWFGCVVVGESVDVPFWIAMGWCGNGVMGIGFLVFIILTKRK